VGEPEIINLQLVNQKPSWLCCNELCKINKDLGVGLKSLV
jgi:hypothetical protein